MLKKLKEGKFVFIMTSSGKPVYSYNIPEEELVNTFSFLQAVISIVGAVDDQVKAITTGDTKIVFNFRNSLYFILVSSLPESESILLRQLEFLYKNILLILTAKVHDLIKNNPSIDLRNLLGSDADRILNSAGCDSLLTPLSVSFHALPLLLIGQTDKHHLDFGNNNSNSNNNKANSAVDKMKEEINYALKMSVEKCGAACALILAPPVLPSINNNSNNTATTPPPPPLMNHEGRVVAYQLNSSLGLTFGIADLNLLINFVCQSQSLRQNEQSWIPVCLPEVNSQGYLQAYVTPHLELGGGGGADGGFLLIMIAVSAEPSELQNLMKGKSLLQKMLSSIKLPASLSPSSSPSSPSLAAQLDQQHRSLLAHPRQEAFAPLLLHYFFRVNTSMVKLSSSSSNKLHEQAKLDVYYHLCCDFPSPPTAAAATAAGHHPALLASSSACLKILCQYQHLVLCLRKGSAQYEAIGFPLIHRHVQETSASATASSSSSSAMPHTRHGSISGNYFPSSSSSSTSATGGDGGKRLEYSISCGSNSNSSNSKDDNRVDVMQDLVLPDHALVIVSDDMFTYVGLANFGCELYATFPNTIPSVDASKITDRLCQSLKALIINQG